MDGTDDLLVAQSALLVHGGQPSGPQLGRSEHTSQPSIVRAGSQKRTPGCCLERHTSGDGPVAASRVQVRAAGVPAPNSSAQNSAQALMPPASAALTCRRWRMPL